jgi:hypothetical protein
MVRIKTSLNAFVSAWGASVTSRLRAAKIYADAANKGNTDAKAQFWALKGFENWTAQQWSLLYAIGSGILSPLFIDAKDLSVPLAMVHKNVRIEMQVQIFKHGLMAAKLDGSVHTIPYKLVHQKHISQVFKDNGEERTVDEQVQWLLENQKENIEPLTNGCWRVRHGCILTPDDIYRIIAHEDNAPLGAEALIAVATQQARRNR